MKKISSVMYNDQLRYMPINKQHQPESRIENDKERHGKNEH